MSDEISEREARQRRLKEIKRRNLAEIETIKARNQKIRQARKLR